MARVPEAASQVAGGCRGRGGGVMEAGAAWEGLDSGHALAAGAVGTLETAGASVCSDESAGKGGPDSSLGRIWRRRLLAATSGGGRIRWDPTRRISENWEARGPCGACRGVPRVGVPRQRRR